MQCELLLLLLLLLPLEAGIKIRSPNQFESNFCLEMLAAGGRKQSGEHLHNQESLQHAYASL